MEHEETQVGVRALGSWKRGNTTMFDVCISNL